MPRICRCESIAAAILRLDKVNDGFRRSTIRGAAGAAIAAVVVVVVVLAAAVAAVVVDFVVAAAGFAVAAATVVVEEVVEDRSGSLDLQWDLLRMGLFGF